MTMSYDPIPADLQQVALAAPWVPVFNPDGETGAEWAVSAHPPVEGWAMKLAVNLPESIARHIAAVHTASLEATR